MSKVDMEKLKMRCKQIGADGENYAFWLFWYTYGAMEYWLEVEENREKAEFFFENLERAVESYENWQKEKEPSKTA